MVQMPWAENAVNSANVTTFRADVARLSGNREIHAAFEWFHNHTRELADKQIEITSIPAPPFGESRRAEWFRARFAELGLQDVHIDEAGNVLGIRPGIIAGAKYIALTAHLDTVFPPDTRIDIRRDGARLLGPGISDNGSGLIALLAIAGALQAGNISHSSPILFVANVGEEGEGDLRGIRYLFSDARWRDAITSTVVLDGGGTDAIITQGLGSRRFLATVRGPGGHSWSDFGTPNPIVLLARAIDLFSRTAIPSQPRTAFNIGMISGGTSVNAIPESASMKVDIRSVSPAELDHLEKALHEALSQVTTDLTGGGIDPRKAHSVSYELKLIGNRPAAELPSNARLLEVIRAVDAQLGIKARLQRASTDANIPLSLGREAVAIGSGGSGGAAHTLREWYDPLNRELGLRRILLTLLVLAGAE